MVFNLSPERAAKMLREISEGSEPGARFYTMVAVSALIAAFGLIMNNTAIVIGAMLVAPLMTPVFGVALALVCSDASLLGRSLRAEIAGVVLVMAMAALLGFIAPEFETTREMLNRTSPNLMDLCVAVFAGFAGAYAMVDEKISPALPGVAIATAIVPPLANAGLCISLGAYAGAVGSFLLFFANFLSILLVASLIFFASGLARQFHTLRKADLFKKFGLAVIGFFLVTAFLSQELYKIVKRQKTEDKIQAVLIDAFSQMPSTALRKVAFQSHEDQFLVLARIESPKNITPAHVREIEAKIEEILESSTKLIVRRTVTDEISSMGTANPLIVETLDGFTYSQSQNPHLSKIKLAEQTIRDFMASRFGLDLYEVDLLPVEPVPFIIATMGGVRKLVLEEVRHLEKQIQEKVGDGSLQLIIRHVAMDLYDRWGNFRYEWADFEGFGPEEQILLNKISLMIQEELNQKGFYLKSLNFNVSEGTYHVLIELSGARFYSQEELIPFQGKLAKSIGKPVKLHVRSLPEVFVNEQGYASFDKFSESFLKQTEAKSKEKIKILLEKAM